MVEREEGNKAKDWE
jgi:hypothetical protein